MKRYLIPLLLPVMLALMFGVRVSAAPVLQTTPTPTPSPTPGPNNNPVSSFHVDNEQEPPWAVPIFPTFGTGTAQPTLYAATPQHATDYPDQVGTATAQIGSFTGPISLVSTPVAGIMAAGPTAAAGDVDTGIDPIGTGNVTLSGFGSQLVTQITEVVGVARAFALGALELSEYAPWMTPMLVVAVLTSVVDMWVMMIDLIIKSASWLFNLVIKIFVFVGVWKPG